MFRSALFLMAALAGGCAGASQGSPAQASKSEPTGKESPPALEHFMQREIDGELPERAIEAEAWSAQMRAKAPVVVQRDGEATVIVADLGTDAELRCFLYDEPIDVGGPVLHALGSGGDRIQWEQIALTRVAVAAQAPATFVEAVYLAEDAGEKVLGLLKMMVHRRLDHPVFCFHDEVGYTKTFQRIALDFSASLSPKNPTEPERFFEIHVARVEDQPVGFIHRRIAEAAKGWQVTESSTLILTGADGRLLVQDSETALKTTSGGRIISGSWVKAVGGRIVTNIELEEQGRGYRYEGEHRGERLQGAFEPEGEHGLAGPPLVARLIREHLVEGKQSSLQVEEYHPSADASRALTVTYAKKGAREIEVQVGDLTLAARVDERGWVESSKMPFGSTRLTVQRVATKGEL